MSTTTVAAPPTVGDPTSRTGAIFALARVEAVRLLRHPAFLVGLAGSVAVQPLRGGAQDWAGQNYYGSATAWTFVWVGTLVAAALVAGRQRLVADPDLFPATPATPGDRVLGTTLALLAPALATAAAVAVVAAVTASRGGFLLGDEGYTRRIAPHLLEWVQPVLLVILAGVVGIAVAQMRRARLAALLFGGLLTFFGGTVVWAFQAHPVRVLHPFMFPSYEQNLGESFPPEEWGPGDPPLTPPGEYSDTWRATRFDTPALGWHLLYLGGLILVGVWITVRLADRGERRPPRWPVLAGVPLILGAGVAQILTAGVNP